MAKKVKTRRPDTFEPIATSVLWDAAAKIHGPWSVGHRTIENLRLFRDTDVVLGAAYTIRLSRSNESTPDQREAFIRAFDEAPKGSVVVIEVVNDVGGGAFGGILGHRLKQIGVAGVIVEGKIRDEAELKALAPPIWYRTSTMAAPVARCIVTEVSVAVCVGGAIIRPGDLVAADVDGAFVVPREEIAETLKIARELVEADAEGPMHEKLKRGQTVVQIILKTPGH